MECYTNDQHGLLEELLGFYTNQEFNISATNPYFQDYFPPLDQSLAGCSYAAFGDGLSPPDFAVDSQTLPFDDAANEPYNLDTGAPCGPGSVPEPPNSDVGPFRPIRKSKAKKLNGQPSKNLMAERRRRKRLNDRLSLLRSVVPKISKMDRTSILGDTIDYMKELLDRINILQEEIQLDPNQSNMMTLFKNLKPHEITVRNSPKFEVERRDLDTRIEICCGTKPELLLSTVATLEALGLEIQQCVISCFNGFLLQASCSEDLKKRATLDSEDIKQVLLRNAGYGGNSL